MKKKFSLLLISVMAISLLLTACGYVDPDTTVYNGRTGADLRNELEVDVNLTNILASAFTSEYYSLDDIDDEDVKAEIMDAVASYYSVKVSDACYEAIDNWIDVTEECGTWNGGFYLSEKDQAKGEKDYSVDIAGKTMTVNAVLDFDQRDVEVQMVYNVYSGNLTSIDFTPSYTTGEKMQKAGLNTLISMGVVFCVLILISLIIYAFNIFPYLEKKKKAKATKTEESADVVTQIAAREEQQMDDTELIAVISAAIAASEGSSTSDFVVRSINRR